MLTGVFLGQYEIRGWVLGKGHLHRNSVSVSGGQDFHKHVDKTTHPYRTSYKNKLKKLLFELYSSIPEEELPDTAKYSRMGNYDRGSSHKDSHEPFIGGGTFGTGAA